MGQCLRVFSPLMIFFSKWMFLYRKDKIRNYISLLGLDKIIIFRALHIGKRVHGPRVRTNTQSTMVRRTRRGKTLKLCIQISLFWVLGVIPLINSGLLCLKTWSIFSCTTILFFYNTFFTLTLSITVQFSWSLQLWFLLR